MTDLIAAVVLACIFAAIVGTLVALAPTSRAIRLSLLSGAALWTAGVVAVSAMGGFAPGAAGAVPSVVYPFSVLLVAGLSAWRLVPGFRRALLAVPLPALVAVHAGRLFGVFFLLLYAARRLPAPFAPVAGWGDVAVGAAAVPLAALAARGGLPRSWITLWNAVGALDLVTAVSLAILSVPGTPFRVFSGGTGSAATMGTLPWILIPSTLVPIYLLVHRVIARKVTLAAREAGGERARVGAGAADWSRP